MDEIKLELAFKNQQFSGIVVGGHLIEDGEVVDYIKELEENDEGLRDALNLRKGALVQATNGIKQLNERIKELEHVEEFATKNIFFLQGELDKSKTRIKELELRITVLELPAQNYNKTLVRAEQVEARVKELEEGIKKHKDKKYGLVEMRTGKIIAYADFSDEDKELYRLIEKEKP